MKRSSYNTYIPLPDGGVLIHNALINTLAVLDAGEWPDHLTDEAEMARQGFFVPDDFDEARHIREAFTFHRNDPTLMNLSILPTLNCNFRCDYCYEDDHAGNLWMTNEVGDAILRYVRRHARHLKRLFVTWYGGEPLLGAPLIETLSGQLMALCAEADVAYEASVVTNGYLLDERCADILAASAVKRVQVTIDGEKAQHDRRRKLAGGGGTFDAIVKNIRALIDRHGIPVDVRVNVDARNAGGILRMFDELQAAGLKNNQRLRVYFAPIDAPTKACASIACEVLAPAAYGALEIEMIKAAVARGFAFPPYPRYLAGNCAAIRPYGFVILPNGDVHKCWHTVSDPSARVATIWELASGLDIRDRPQYRMWTDWSPFDNPECAPCKLLVLCAGGCAHKQCVGRRNSCLSIKYNLEQMLMLRAESFIAEARKENDP